MIHNMKLGTKLLAGFAAVALITLLLGIVGFYGAVKSDDAIDEITSVRLPGIKSVLEMKVGLDQASIAQRTLLNPENTLEIRQLQYDTMARARQQFQDAMTVYESLPRSSEEDREWQSLLGVVSEWHRMDQEFLRLCQTFDAIDILNPTQMLWDLERFRGDTFALQTRALEMVALTETMLDVQDVADTALGRWLADFSTRNERIEHVVTDLEEVSSRLYAIVGPIRAAIDNLNDYRAGLHYRDEMVPEAQAFQQLLEQLIEEVSRAEALRSRITELAMDQASDLERRAFMHLDNLIRLNDAMVVATAEQSSAEAGFLKLFSLVAMVVGVCLALFIGLAITRSTTRSIQRVIAGLTDSCEQVSSASDQVALSNQSLAEGTSEQAASLEETSSSMEEMASMTKQNADNAFQAKAMMDEIRLLVARVDQHMEEMAGAVNDITRSSEETSKIIKTIDEIAFQTNLLALNAAVEAARAGEAGAGFAVVADEVRNLAIRAAEAAKNTSLLIETTVKSVKKGNELTTSTRDAFKENIAMSDKIGQLVDEIATASNEQSSGIGQVNTALGQMDVVTQKSAATAEESASAAQEMSAQAEQMLAMVKELIEIVGHSSSHSGQDYSTKAKLLDR